MDSKGSRDAEVGRLSQEIRAGSVRALSRGLTLIEAGGPRAEALIEALFSTQGWAHIVGITGGAGAGKSTLVAALTKAARRRGITVGILAVDPSSPFTGGAVLGDRVRMHDLAGDEGVFIRSMAARGELGGLCAAASGGIDLLRAAGKRMVLVETVGAGQDEVDVMRVAHTTVLVNVPGLGDDVQMMKAGLFEIADIHVVNKADREGSGETIAQIRAMLALAAGQGDDGKWQPPVVATVALGGTGVEEALDAIAAHAAHLHKSGDLAERERRMAEARVVKLAQAMVASSLREPRFSSNAVERVARRELSPYACAKKLIERARTTF